MPRHVIEKTTPEGGDAMSEPLREARDPLVVLADAVNQLAMVIEEIGWYAAQHGYTDTTYPRRRRWQAEVRKLRNEIAGLIPE